MEPQWRNGERVRFLPGRLWVRIPPAVLRHEHGCSRVGGTVEAQRLLTVPFEYSHHPGLHECPGGHIIHSPHGIPIGLSRSLVHKETSSK